MSSSNKAKTNPAGSPHPGGNPARPAGGTNPANRSHTSLEAQQQRQDKITRACNEGLQALGQLNSEEQQAKFLNTLAAFCGYSMVPRADYIEFLLWRRQNTQGVSAAGTEGERMPGETGEQPASYAAGR